LATLEGHLVTPTVLGRRLTLDPLAVFLAIAFWGWLWGPMGAFLAVPLLIVGMVIVGHVFPSDDLKLPG
jgi:predicted PurR-regulated permease PerM